MNLNSTDMEMGKTYRYDPETLGHKSERRGKASKFFKKPLLDLRRRKKQRIKDQEDLLRNDNELNLKEYVNG